METNRLVMVAMAALWSGASFAGAEGPTSTIYGTGAGAATSLSAENTFFGAGAGNAATGAGNTFIGRSAGRLMVGGVANTLVGLDAGENLTTGIFNTAIGAFAGGAGLQTGSRNVFIGYSAGYAATGSNKLYIDNCVDAGVPACSRPLIYGEFDNRRLEFDGVLGVTANRSAQAARSQLHFSVAGNDVGGWVTSAGDNNFFTSSGARYDADAGGWIQRSADGKAVIAGSGGVGYRIFTAAGAAVGAVAAPVTRLHIDYNGLVGVNAAPVAGRAINTSTGAYLSSGGVWTNASSRALKRDIRALSGEAAEVALDALQPVTFRYGAEEGETHVGFIAEDVPELVATADRKGLASMDVVAVLTQVAKRQKATIEAQRLELGEMKSELRALAAEVRRLRAR